VPIDEVSLWIVCEIITVKLLTFEETCINAYLVQSVGAVFLSIAELADSNTGG